MYYFQQVVKPLEGEQLAKEYGIKFFEASAKLGSNVEESFLSIAKDVKDRLVAHGLPSTPATIQVISNNNTGPIKKKPCCWWKL